MGTEDEDYQLALRLQREEQEAYRRERERIIAANHRIAQNRIQDELSSEVDAYLRLEPPSREAPKPKPRGDRANGYGYTEDDSKDVPRVDNRLDNQRGIAVEGTREHLEEQRRNLEDQATRERREKRAKDKERLERDRRQRAVPLAGTALVKKKTHDEATADENDRFDLFIHDRQAPARPAVPNQPPVREPAYAAPVHRPAAAAAQQYAPRNVAPPSPRPPAADVRAPTPGLGSPAVQQQERRLLANGRCFVRLPRHSSPEFSAKVGCN